MALVRWKNRGEMTPFSALRDLEGQFNRMFDEMFEGNAGGRGWSPAIDLVETEDNYLIEADLPGMHKDDIELVVVDNLVTIKGERKYQSEARREGYHRFERQYGNFQRTFEIPGGFRGDAVDAKFENGVLRVTLPKREEMKPKQIEVKVS
jgi:HSP20 family protein